MQPIHVLFWYFLFSKMECNINTLPQNLKISEALKKNEILKRDLSFSRCFLYWVHFVWRCMLENKKHNFFSPGLTKSNLLSSVLMFQHEVFKHRNTYSFRKSTISYILIAGLVFTQTLLLYLLNHIDHIGQLLTQQTSLSLAVCQHAAS